ncbi:secretin and TonB N-terminal domain-containing protein [Chitinibacter fontanus]|uniref:Secretin and TonB N-terminal domain-containing protein n=1 Tax=Chitinibacter fontanus TaxID=1737446 RepID=A0A7D5ZGB0_9NEIS|nr:secretin N-terminal domain-containing protein [Chitinibacter fontanus]QLI82564.1 secretin and TonB N-terminal domain-containing protein [Chitinibacter fontanus]
MKRALMTSIISMAFLGGCAADIARYQAETQLDAGNPEAALTTLKAQIASSPNDLKLRAAYQNNVLIYVNRLIMQGDQARQQGNSAVAISNYQQALQWDSTNIRAQEGIRYVEMGVRHDSMLRYARENKDGKPDEVLGIVNQILLDNPRNVAAQTIKNDIENRKSREVSLRPALAQALKSPISLQFRDQSMMSVFDIVSRIGKVNFIFDKDVPPNLKTTIYARDTTVEDVINLILATNQLDKKILNDNTILIYPKRPDKDRDYKDMVMRTFYLSNADPKQVLAMLKQMVKTRDIYIDERLSMLVMRDTPEAIAVAERLIAAQDLPQSEVLLDVEVLEVSNNDVLDLGILYPGSVSATVYGNTIGAVPVITKNADGTSTTTTPTKVAGQVTLDQIGNINKSDILVNLGTPTVTANFLQSKGNTNVLANPKIRVKNRDKAKILIGDRVPVVTTTTSNGVSSESVNYQDVGLTLNVEPVMTVDNEISIKVNLEVSNIVKTITSKGGLIAYQIGTRRAETNMSARDGETQALAGLLSRTESETGQGLPFLSSVPGLDRIFGTKKSDNSKTELIMLITPRVIRSLPLPPSHITGFDSGTEGMISTDPLRLRPSSTFSINNQGGQSLPYVPPAPPPAPEPQQAAPQQPAQPGQPEGTPVNRGTGMGRR